MAFNRSFFRETLKCSTEKVKFYNVPSLPPYIYCHNQIVEILVFSVIKPEVVVSVVQFQKPHPYAYLLSVIMDTVHFFHNSFDKH